MHKASYSLEANTSGCFSISRMLSILNTVAKKIKSSLINIYQQCHNFHPLISEFHSRQKHHKCNHSSTAINVLDDRLLRSAAFHCSRVWRASRAAPFLPLLLKSILASFHWGRRRRGWVRLVKVNCFCSSDRARLARSPADYWRLHKKLAGCLSPTGQTRRPSLAGVTVLGGRGRHLPDGSYQGSPGVC